MSLAWAVPAAFALAGILRRGHQSSLNITHTVAQLMSPIERPTAMQTLFGSEPSVKEQMTDRPHSRFGGSTASRWMNCAGSTALIATVPPMPGSTYAAEGKLAHALAEWCLTEKVRLLAQIDFPYEIRSEAFVNGEPLKEIPDDMRQAVQTYLDAVWTEVDAAPDAQLFVEHGFVIPAPSAAEGEVFGTNDALVYTPSRKRLAVFDYKHGVGVSVSAEDNAQLKFYACGAALSNKGWGVREVELIVVQPRVFDADDQGAVRRWTMNPLDLIDFSGEIDNAIVKANSDDPPLQVGDYCRWCPAAAVCPAREDQVLRAAQLDFANVTEITAEALPKPAEMDVERLAAVLAASDILQGWMDQVRERVEALLMVDNVPVPGWKIVDKVARAKWVASEEDVSSYLSLVHDIPEDDLRPRKLVTITEAERQIKAVVTDKEKRKKALDDLRVRFTIKEPSGRTIARDSDRRPAVDAVATDFASVQLDAN